MNGYSLLGLFVALFALQANAQEFIELRVMSYNIHHGQGIDGKLDLGRIAALIKDEHVDIVALQEVDQDVPRSNNVNQPYELAKLTELQVAFGSNIKLQGGKYGNAILSRFPIDESQNVTLPNVGNGEQRGLLEVRINLPNSEEPLQVLATHFDHRRDRLERLKSVEFINERYEDETLPTLLMGDLNTTQDGEPFRILQSRWTAANSRPQPTVPASKPTRQIDFILYSPDSRWEVVQTKVLEEAVASDHRAILSILRLKLE